MGIHTSLEVWEPKEIWEAILEIEPKLLNLENLLKPKGVIWIGLKMIEPCGWLKVKLLLLTEVGKCGTVKPSEKENRNSLFSREARNLDNLPKLLTHQFQRIIDGSCIWILFCSKLHRNSCWLESISDKSMAQKKCLVAWGTNHKCQFSTAFFYPKLHIITNCHSSLHPINITVTSIVPSKNIAFFPLKLQ